MQVTWRIPGVLREEVLLGFGFQLSRYESLWPQQLTIG